MGGECRNDIIVHSSCDVSCDVNRPMNGGDTHWLASGVTSYTLTADTLSKKNRGNKILQICSNGRFSS